METCTSLLWYDLETFGIDPARDRIAQFAAIRTDLDLNIIGDPVALYCRPGMDYLPHPAACAVTGISPQKCWQSGTSEYDFISRINELFSEPGTCVAGFNNIRFDDEFIRYALYRNLFDPYAREWANGNSRWDLIDVIRLMHATRPEGIQWPVDENGAPSLKLEALSAANGIEHAAHDALADVRATIAVARLAKSAQPKLFDYCFANRSKHAVAKHAYPLLAKPIVHVSRMFSNQRKNTAVMATLGQHPTISSQVFAYDLSVDPKNFISLSIEQLRERIFARTDDMDGPRLPVKAIHLNKAPVVAPIGVLNAGVQQRLGVSLAECEANLLTLQTTPDFVNNIIAALTSDERTFDVDDDPETQLYDGFIPNDDRRTLEHMHADEATEWPNYLDQFMDDRLPVLGSRVLARSFPEALNAEQLSAWGEHCQQALHFPHPKKLNVESFNAELQETEGLSDELRAALQGYPDYLESVIAKSL